METEAELQDTGEYTSLRLNSANGPVFRRIKRTPLRDARADEIPTIDISRLNSNSLDDRKTVAAQIHHASTNNGFFYITNHGIDPSVIKSAHQSSLEFFRQPDEIKQHVNAERSPCLNGWKPPKTQRINAAESIDVRETFSFRYNPTCDPTISSDPAEIPHDIISSLITNEFCWDLTTNLPHLKADIIAYWRATLALARKLTQAFALALSLPETHFDPKVTYPDAGVALNYYPSIPPLAPFSTQNQESQGEQVSIGSHTDFQLFTILWQDCVGGLQVLNRQGEWINAKPIEGTFVVNIGDYLQRITNDLYVSTVHRARNLSGRERVSMPLFFGFGLHESCGVLESCMSEERPAKYESISCKEWVEMRVRQMHTTD